MEHNLHLISHLQGIPLYDQTHSYSIYASLCLDNVPNYTPTNVRCMIELISCVKYIHENKKVDWPTWLSGVSTLGAVSLVIPPVFSS